MMPAISRAKNAHSLVAYLAGPTNEHENQRVITSSLGREGELDREMTARVVADLRAPGLAYPGVAPAKGEFWHCSLSLPPDEAPVTDEQWRSIVRDFMVEMGFDGDHVGRSRWFAVGHGVSSGGDQHVHIAASLVREDGRTVDVWKDFRNAQDACHSLEVRYGLRVLQSRVAGVSRPPIPRGEWERNRKAGGCLL